MQEIFVKIKSLFRTPMLLVFIVICVSFLPKAINMQSAVFRSAIVVAFGIDMDNNNRYEINAAINVSSKDESLSENTKLISAKGASVSEAITNLSIQFGRAIKFGHTRFLLIGTNFAKQNVAVALDGVIRTNKMRDTIQLILCDANIADMLNIGIEIKNKTGIKMSEIITYQSEYSTVSMDSNVDTFYKGYFSRTGISKLNCITLTDDYTEGITPEAALGEATSPQAPDAGNESSGETKADKGPLGSSSQNGGASGGGSGEGQQNKKKYLSSTGKIGVFKNGKLQSIISKEIADGSHWISPAYLPKKLEVDITNKFLSNAQVYFYVLEKSVDTEVFFYKDIPMFSAKLNVTLGIDEIINSNQSITPLSTDVVDEDLKCAIGRKIRVELAQALKYSRLNNLDILDLNELFYLTNYGKYMEYINSGKNINNFVEDVQISIEVRVKVI